MSPRLQGALVAGTGAAAVHLAASGQHLHYLKAGMRLPLLAAGAAMLLLGGLTFVRAFTGRRATSPAPDVDDAHDHHDQHAGHAGPVVAWLLLLPVLALVVVRPPALGADAARRDTPERQPAAPRANFEPLPPPRDDAVDLAVSEFRARAAYDDPHLVGTTVRLTGFVVNDPALAAGYRLTRFRILCCAADAIPVQIVIDGLDGPPPPDDTWVEIVGEWAPPEDPAAGSIDDVTVSLHTQTEVPPPAEPYE